jgi:hypothetical protein
VPRDEVTSYGRRAYVMEPSYIPAKRLSGLWGLHRLVPTIKLILQRRSRLSPHLSRIHTLKFEDLPDICTALQLLSYPTSPDMNKALHLYDYTLVACLRSHFNTIERYSSVSWIGNHDDCTYSSTRNFFMILDMLLSVGTNFRDPRGLMDKDDIG